MRGKKRRERSVGSFILFCVGRGEEGINRGFGIYVNFHGKV